MTGEDAQPALHEQFHRAAAGVEKGRCRSKGAKPVSIRLNDEERAFLTREAGKLSLSAHMRKKLLGDSGDGASQRRVSLRRRVPRVDQESLGRALALLGRNDFARRLDELATAAVMGALPLGPELIEELHAVCSYIRAMRDALMQALEVEKGGER